MEHSLTQHVAPFVGAWIEIDFASIIKTVKAGRSVRRSVD